MTSKARTRMIAKVQEVIRDLEHASILAGEIEADLFSMFTTITSRTRAGEGAGHINSAIDKFMAVKQDLERRD